MSESDVRDVIIIGGGPAGYTAALYAARANLSPLVIEGFAWGGQLMITSDVENYPGYPEGVLGPEMMARLPPAGRALRRRVPHRRRHRASTSPSGRSASSVGDDEYRAKTVIVATGATARQLGPRVRAHACRAAASRYCAVCDAAFFREKEVVVVGGGDSAMEEAIFLTKFATKVTRRPPARRVPRLADHDRPRPRQRQDRVRHALRRRRGARRGRQARPASACANVETGETRELPADGLFVAIGHDPNTTLFVGQLDMDEAGYLITQAGLDGDERRGRVRGRRRASTTPTGRRSRRPASAAWRRSTPSAGSPSAKATRGRARPRLGPKRPRSDRRSDQRRRYDCRRAVLHLPELQGPLHRHRRRRGLHAAGRGVPPLRLRLPVRADGRLLPRARRRAWSSATPRAASSRSAGASSSSRATASRT